MALNKLIDDAYIEIKDQITSKKLDISDALILVARTMELVESKYQIKGEEKKTIVINVIHRVYDDFIKNNPDMASVKPLIEAFINSDQLSNAIEVIIMASRGIIKLNSGKGCKKKFSKCCRK